MKFATLPRILRRGLQTSTSQSTKSLPLPRETHHFGASSNPPRLPTFLQPSRTPAPAAYFATCRNPCACHAKSTFNLQKRPEAVRFQRFWLPNRSRAQAWCKFWEAQLPKVFRTCSVVPFFRKNRSRAQAWCKFCRCQLPKSSGPASFSRFGLPNRSRAQAWCKFCEAQLPKVFRACQFLTILTSESLSRAGVVQILSASWAADPPQLPFFGPTFASLRSDETMEKHSLSRNSYPPKSLMSHICAVKHLCCPTSMLQDLPATFSIVGS